MSQACRDIGSFGRLVNLTSGAGLGPCGSPLRYNSCCNVGDACLINGVCQVAGESSYLSAYYFSGCNDQAGESGTCTGSCPVGYDQLTWDQEVKQWWCCPENVTISTLSLSTICRFTFARDDTDEIFWPYQYTPPDQLYATAVVLDTDSAHTLPSETIAAASLSVFSANAEPTGYDYPYHYSTSSTSTSTTPFPTLTDSESNCLGNCSASPGLVGISLFITLLSVGAAVVLIGIVVGIILCVRRRRRRKMTPSPALGQVIYQNFQPGPGSKGVYDPKMATASVHTAPQQQQFLQPPMQAYGPNRTSPSPQFLHPVAPLSPLSAPGIVETGQQDQGPRGQEADGKSAESVSGAESAVSAIADASSTSMSQQNAVASPEAPSRSPPPPPVETAEVQACQSESKDGTARAPSRLDIPTIQVTPNLTPEQHHKEFYA